MGIGARSFFYNQGNRLIRVEENGTALGEYAYNGFDQRVKKTVEGTTTIFFFSGGNPF